MNYKQSAAALAEEIMREGYFPSKFVKCLERNKMTLEGMEKQAYTNSRIVVMFNDFWDALPDEEYIRTPTFFKVCDIAEGIFDEQPDESDEAE